MSDITKSAKRVARFPRRAKLIPVEATSLAMSPRRSNLDTAVLLSPEDYEALLDVRDAYLAEHGTHESENQ